MSHTVSRRTLLAGAAAFPLATVFTRPVRAAEFEYKLATGQDPTHRSTSARRKR